LVVFVDKHAGIHADGRRQAPGVEVAVEDGGALEVVGLDDAYVFGHIQALAVSRHRQDLFCHLKEMIVSSEPSVSVIVVEDGQNSFVAVEAHRPLLEDCVIPLNLVHVT